LTLSEADWVTVIIPTYNRAHLIGKTIQSVFAQTYERWDIVVVDDGSTDETAQVVAQFSDRVTYLQIPHSGLSAVARNVGIAHAQGEFVAFLDSDDLWLPTKLAVQVAAMKRNPQAGLVCTNAIQFSESPQGAERVFWCNDLPSSGKIFHRLYQGNFIVTSTVLVRRECFEIVGKFNEDLSLRTGQDYELWLRLAAHHDVICIPEVLARYRVHQIRLDRSLQENLIREANILLGTRDRYPDLVGQLGSSANRRIAQVYRELGRYSFKHNRFLDARKYFDLALQWYLGNAELRLMRLLSGVGFLPVAQLLSVRDRVFRRKAKNVAN
jgi:glycosyltransferase involved in cell wall biosynthesis